jgi:hypothetical protein
MSKSEKMIEIDGMIEKWQETRCEKLANEIYAKFRTYLNTKGNTVDDISDAHYSLARAMLTWRKESNVYFITWFQRLWGQQKGELIEYLTRPKRSGQQLIPLDSMAYQNNDEIQVADVIPDENQRKSMKKRENAKMLMDFLDEHNVSDRERMIIENIYFDIGWWQTDLAKMSGVTQAMIHKSFKSISKRPYAPALYQLLRELMRND